MTNQRGPATEPPVAAGPTYPQQGNRAFEQELAGRTAAQEAAFLLPQLRPGLRLLDVGCGPGSITVGLAAAVTPGVVVGIDLQPAQARQAGEHARAHGVTTVHVAAADAYQLPFPDGAFDVVFAHAVLMHLREPVQTLREWRRVLRADGVVGLRDPDGGGNLLVPELPLLAQWRSIAERVRQHQGSTLFIGRQHRRLLMEAGFTRTQARATVTSSGTVEQARSQAVFFKAQLQGLARTALAQGWLEQATVAAIAAEFDAWAERPDAFATGLWCETLGWVGS